jgi:hypothetical protein
MSNLTDTWGLYPLFSTAYQDDNVHPDDFEEFRLLHPHSKVFHCVDEVDGYLVLQYQDKKYRIKPEKYQVLPEPKFTFNEQVIDPNHPDKVGIIRHIGWHFKYKKHLFAIELDGKPKSRQYFAEDFKDEL